MSAGEPGVRATAVDPDGRTVVLREERWRHIVNGHPELRSLERKIIEAVERPTVRRPGRSHSETWHYLELRPPRPAPWLKVVVRYGAQEGLVVTAFLRRSMP